MIDTRYLHTDVYLEHLQKIVQTIGRISRHFNVDPKDAEQRVLNREEKRAAFIKRAFKQDIRLSAHYDMVVNTGILTQDAAARLICAAWCLKFIE